jgi:hypothetical protein
MKKKKRKKKELILGLIPKISPKNTLKKKKKPVTGPDTTGTGR